MCVLEQNRVRFGGGKVKNVTDVLAAVDDGRRRGRWPGPWDGGRRRGRQACKGVDGGLVARRWPSC